LEISLKRKRHSGLFPVPFLNFNQNTEIMKKLILVLVTFFIVGAVAAQVDSTMTTQLNRQIQNKSSMNKSSGNTQAPSTENIQDTRKVKAMLNGNSKSTIYTQKQAPPPVPPPSPGTPQPPENSNAVTPSTLNGNDPIKNGATKVPEP
jgi:hypothetical protein